MSFIVPCAPISNGIVGLAKCEDWGLGTGDWRLATGDWGLGTGDWRLGTGDWGLATGDWRLGTGDWTILFLIPNP
ncbi:hypothetical protein NIES4073_07780 [Kalymmatonema gypsitolerans NIES-4073]|nr:hypothetical protein NIES4073_07780 [Scytonema sp. NIES-4073]